MYTVYLSCIGGGKVSIRMDDGKVKTWTCDGVPNRQIYLTDDRRHHGAVTVSGDAQWSLGIIDGAP